MKIIVNNGPGAFSFIRRGYLNALQLLDHEVYMCEYEDPNYHRIIEQIKPDLIIGSTWEINDAALETIIKNRIKVILRLPEWSDFTDTVNSDLCRATPREIDMCKELVRLELMTFGHTYYLQRWVDITLDKWKCLGIPLVESLLAADTTVYYPTIKSETFSSDFAFVGGYWAYKAPNLNWIVELSKHFNGAIYGYSQWPTPKWKGSIGTSVEKFVFTNAAVCPNVMEPFAIEYGFDINERTYKTLACGGMSLVQNNDSVAEVFGDSVDTFSSQEELIDKTKYYIENPGKRKDFINRGLDLIHKKHNYIERVNKWMSLLH